jgi:hypothetical protein
MNELSLNIQQNPGCIELNFEEIEERLDKKLAEYKGAVFTEETKDIAKAELASLRKFKKEFEDARKNVKKEWMKPYDDFEQKMKILTGKIDQPIHLIDSQVKDFEKKRKEEKRLRIKEIYADLIGDMKEYLSLEKIYDPKWENATTTEKSIKEAINKAVDKVKTDVDVICGMRSESVWKALEKYKDTLNLQECIQYINKYEEQKAEILRREEERKKQEYKEAQRRLEEEIRREERERIERENQIKETAVAEAVAKAKFAEAEVTGLENDTELPFVQPTTITAFYKIVATPEELEEVEMAFNSIGIWFERRLG